MGASRSIGAAADVLTAYRVFDEAGGIVTAAYAGVYSKVPDAGSFYGLTFDPCALILAKLPTQANPVLL